MREGVMREGVMREGGWWGEGVGGWCVCGGSCRRMSIWNRCHSEQV